MDNLDEIQFPPGWEIERLADGAVRFKQDTGESGGSWVLAAIGVILFGSIAAVMVAVAVDSSDSSHPTSLLGWLVWLLFFALMAGASVGTVGFIYSVANNVQDWMAGPNHLQFNWGNRHKKARKSRIYPLTSFKMVWLEDGGENSDPRWELQFATTVGWTNPVVIWRTNTKPDCSVEELLKLGRCFSQATGWDLFVPVELRQELRWVEASEAPPGAISQLKTQAEFHRIRLESGLVAVSEVIAWCDAIIEAEPEPDVALLEATLEGSAGGFAVAEKLREVAGRADAAALRRRLFEMLLQLLDAGAENAEWVVARALHEFLQEEWYFDFEHFRDMPHFEESLELAMEGIGYERNQIIQQMREFLNSPDGVGQ